jgi:dihydroorotate dehydrogenase
MGWYQTVGRRAFFAMPPESSHRAAQALLSWPLPWLRVGGAFTDLSLAVTLAGVPLRNPIGLAAGFDKTCRHLDALGALGFGYVVGGTITRAARAGHASPRIVRYPKRRSMTNAMGLPNPGAEAAAANLARTAGGPAPRFVSIADEEVADAVETLDLLVPGADGIELNASCPNVAWGRDRDQEAHLATLVAALVARTDRPVFVKLPPIATAIEGEVVSALAGVAQSAGARGLTCSNTRLVGDARLAVGMGGLSGRALWPGTAATVATVHEATGGAMAINACGGIFTADDIVTCLEAGATTVQIYTALVYEGPGVVGRLTRELAAHRLAQGLAAGQDGSPAPKA